MKHDEEWFRQYGSLELRRYTGGLVYELETDYLVFRGYGTDDQDGKVKAIEELYYNVNNAVRRTCNIISWGKEK